MLKMSICHVLAAIACLSVAHGALLWDGRFNDLSSAVDLDRWSWTNQVIGNSLLPSIPFKSHRKWSQDEESTEISGSTTRIHGLS